MGGSSRAESLRFVAIVCRPFHGLNRFFPFIILGLTPQALFFRLLRRLNHLKLGGGFSVAG